MWGLAGMVGCTGFGEMGRCALALMPLPRAVSLTGVSSPEQPGSCGTHFPHESFLSSTHCVFVSSTWGSEK